MKSYKKSLKTYNRLVWEDMALKFAKAYFDEWSLTKVVKLEVNGIEFTASNFNGESRIDYVWDKKKFQVERKNI